MSLSVDTLFQRLYPNLRRVAYRTMEWGTPDGIVQPTSLLHDAYLRVHSYEEGKFESDAQFIRYLALTMRSLLFDAARVQIRREKLLPRTYISLEELESKTEWRASWILDFDEALDRMEAQDKHLFEVVILRVFLGLPIKEIAVALDRKLRTTELHWNLAKRCLGRLSP